MIDWVADARNRMILNDRPAYQGKKQVALLKLCTRFRTALDIGAHIGTWTHNLAPNFQTVRSFEPVKDHRDCFALNITAQNVIVYPLALGDQDTMVDMHTGPSSTGDTWVELPVNGHVGTVRMLRLDDFDWHDIDLIKIDAEGFEESILRGGLETVKRCRPVICVEQKRDMPKKWGMEPQGAVRLLQQNGYRVAMEIGGDYMMTAAA